MAGFGGLTETGRQVRGAASTIVELEDAGQVQHLAIVFREEFRELQGLREAVDLARSFLEFPMVVGVVDLRDQIVDEGAFIYQTGPVWVLTELLRRFRDTSQVIGVRAAMDLCYLAAGILQEAAENGPPQGVFSHGGLTPDRILVDGQGGVRILGYGLPQVEVMAFLDGSSTFEPREDSWRYCPPERINGGGEDVDADLYALALIAWEMITGEPMYTGTPDEVRQQASRGEAATRLRGRVSGIPGPVVEFLAQAVEFDPRRRFEDGHEFLHTLYDTFANTEIPGITLAEVMQRMGPAPQRGRSLVSADPNHIAAGAGHIAAGAGHIAAGAGHIAAGAGHIAASAGHIAASAGHIAASAGHIAASAGHTAASAGTDSRRAPPPGMGGRVLRAPGSGGRAQASSSSSDGRWGKVDRDGDSASSRRKPRRRGRAAAESDETLPATTEEESSSRRTPRRAPRRSGSTDGESSTSSRRTPRRRSSTDGESEAKRRTPRRSSASTDGEPEETRPARRTPSRSASSSTDGDSPGARRAPRRRSSSTDGESSSTDGESSSTSTRRTPRRAPRRSNKKPAADTPPAEDTPSEDTAVATTEAPAEEKKPRRAPRRPPRRKKKAASTDE